MLAYEAVIIGAGQSGVPLAMKLSKDGIKTALVEKRLVGGTCINDGCTPTKTLIASAEQVYRIENSEKLGIHVPSYNIDFQAVMQRKNDIVKQSREGSEKAIEEAENLTLFKGKAHFMAPKEIRVNQGMESAVLKGKYIFIDGGLRPAIPPLEGLDKVPFLTSTTLLDLKECPEHLIIIGGSYIGLEMVQLFSRLGSRITIIEKSERVLAKEDADVAEAIQDILRKEDIRFFLGAKVNSVHGQHPTVNIVVDGKEEQIKGTHLLMATGRKPQTEDLDLEKAGIKTDEHGFIEVDDQLETSIKGIYAMGDIKGGAAFTHISYNDYVIIYDNLMNGANRKYVYRQEPYCLFTDPQLGRIGLTESMAKKQGLEIDVFKLPMEKSSRGKETVQIQGFMKAV